MFITWGYLYLFLLDMELIRQVCDWDKRRRLGVKGPPPPLQPVENHVIPHKQTVVKHSIQGTLNSIQFKFQ